MYCTSETTYYRLNACKMSYNLHMKWTNQIQCWAVRVANYPSPLLTSSLNVSVLVILNELWDASFKTRLICHLLNRRISMSENIIRYFCKLFIYSSKICAHFFTGVTFALLIFRQCKKKQAVKVRYAWYFFKV